MPRKASELGACWDLEGHIFTISSGNKVKDGDMLCTLKEKMATYIGTKYGDNAAQEWTSKNCIILAEPTYLSAIVTRHTKKSTGNLRVTQLKNDQSHSPRPHDKEARDSKPNSQV